MENQINENDLSSNVEQTPQQDLKNNKTKKSKVWKVFRILFRILLVIPILIILFSCSVLVVEAISTPNGMPGNFEYKPCVERYGMMEPEIQKGDLIIVEKTDFSEL